MEEPHPQLLNRQEAIETVAKHFAPQLELLTQMSNYASNLMPRAYSSSEKKRRDIVICYALLKQFATMLDATEVLMRAGARQAAFLQTRTAFEVSLYLEWMLVADGESKALHFLVGNFRQERLWALRAIEEAPESPKFLKDMGSLGADLLANQPKLDAEAKKHLAQVNLILGSGPYADTNKAFDVFIEKHSSIYEPHWYQVMGVPTVRALAKKLHRLGEYIISYDAGSQVTHSSSYKEHFTLDDTGAKISPIRNLAHISEVLHSLFCTSMLVFIRVLGFYRPHELAAFNKLYFTEWREAFRNIPQVQMEASPSSAPQGASV